MKDISNTTQALNDTIGRALTQAVNIQASGPEKVNICITVAFNAVTSIAALIMEGFNPNTGSFPTNDHCLLALFMISESCQILPNTEARCEFSPVLLWEALKSFERFTGRNGETLLNKKLLQIIHEQTDIDSSKFGTNSKFLQ